MNGTEEEKKTQCKNKRKCCLMANEQRNGRKLQKQLHNTWHASMRVDEMGTQA
jgi:hypothetical protein